MADIQKINGYWVKDASARKFIEDDEKAIAAAISNILSGVGLDTILKLVWKLELIDEYGYQPMKEMIECVDTSLLNHDHDSTYIKLSGSSAITGNLTPSSTTPTLGTSTNPWGAVYTLNSTVETSDINKKNVIGEIDLNKAYELIDKCSTIIYTLKDDPDLKEQIGTIAQEVKEFFPEIVETNEDGSLMLSYSRLTVVLMRVMKDLINRVQKLENKQ